MGLQKGISKTIPRVGRVEEYRWFNGGAGTRVARDLLYRWAVASARYCAQYMRAVGVPDSDYPPFVYGERQLTTFLTPALFSVTGGAMMPEAKAQRKVSVSSGGSFEEAFGRVDYWCSYRRIVFAIEVKHGFLAIRSNVIRQQLLDAWSGADVQLDELEQQAKEWASERGAMRIAFAVIPFYYAGENSGSMTDAKLCEQGLLRLKTNLRPYPDWGLLWYLHDHLAGPYEYEYANASESYPALAFIARVRDLQQ